MSTFQDIQISHGDLEARKRTKSFISGELFYDYNTSTLFIGGSDKYSTKLNDQQIPHPIGGLNDIKWMGDWSYNILPSNPLPGHIYKCLVPISAAQFVKPEELENIQREIATNSNFNPNEYVRKGDFILYYEDTSNKKTPTNEGYWVKIDNSTGEAFLVDFNPISLTDIPEVANSVQAAISSLDRFKLGYGGELFYPEGTVVKEQILNDLLVGKLYYASNDFKIEQEENTYRQVFWRREHCVDLRGEFENVPKTDLTELDKIESDTIINTSTKDEYIYISQGKEFNSELFESTQIFPNNINHHQIFFGDALFNPTDVTILQSRLIGTNKSTYINNWNYQEHKTKVANNFQVRVGDYYLNTNGYGVYVALTGGVETSDVKWKYIGKLFDTITSEDILSDKPFVYHKKVRVGQPLYEDTTIEIDNETYIVQYCYEIPETPNSDVFEVDPIDCIRLGFKQATDNILVTNPNFLEDSQPLSSENDFIVRLPHFNRESTVKILVNSYLNPPTESALEDTPENGHILKPGVYLFTGNEPDYYLDRVLTNYFTRREVESQQLQFEEELTSITDEMLPKMELLRNTIIDCKTRLLGYPTLENLNELNDLTQEKQDIEKRLQAIQIHLNKHPNFRWVGYDLEDEAFNEERLMDAATRWVLEQDPDLLITRNTYEHFEPVWDDDVVEGSSPIFLGNIRDVKALNYKLPNSANYELNSTIPNIYVSLKKMENEVWLAQYEEKINTQITEETRLESELLELNRVLSESQLAYKLFNESQVPEEVTNEDIQPSNIENFRTQSLHIIDTFKNLSMDDCRIAATALLHISEDEQLQDLFRETQYQIQWENFIALEDTSTLIELLFSLTTPQTIDWGYIEEFRNRDLSNITIEAINPITDIVSNLSNTLLLLQEFNHKLEIKIEAEEGVLTEDEKRAFVVVGSTCRILQEAYEILPLEKYQEFYTTLHTGYETSLRETQNNIIITLESKKYYRKRYKELYDEIYNTIGISYNNKFDEFTYTYVNFLNEEESEVYNSIESLRENTPIGLNQLLELYTLEEVYVQNKLSQITTEIELKQNLELVDVPSFFTNDVTPLITYLNNFYQYKTTQLCQLPDLNLVGFEPSEIEKERCTNYLLNTNFEEIWENTKEKVNKLDVYNKVVDEVVTELENNLETKDYKLRDVDFGSEGIDWYPSTTPYINNELFLLGDEGIFVKGSPKDLKTYLEDVVLEFFEKWHEKHNFVMYGEKSLFHKLPQDYIYYDLANNTLPQSEQDDVEEWYEELSNLKVDESQITGDALRFNEIFKEIKSINRVDLGIDIKSLYTPISLPDFSDLQAQIWNDPSKQLDLGGVYTFKSLDITLNPLIRGAMIFNDAAYFRVFCTLYGEVFVIGGESWYDVQDFSREFATHVDTRNIRDFVSSYISRNNDLSYTKLCRVHLKSLPMRLHIIPYIPLQNISNRILVGAISYYARHHDDALLRNYALAYLRDYDLERMLNGNILMSNILNNLNVDTNTWLNLTTTQTLDPGVLTTVSNLSSNKQYLDTFCGLDIVPLNILTNLEQKYKIHLFENATPLEVNNFIIKPNDLCELKGKENKRFFTFNGGSILESNLYTNEYKIQPINLSIFKKEALTKYENIATTYFSEDYITEKYLKGVDDYNRDTWSSSFDKQFQIYKDNVYEISTLSPEEHFPIVNDEQANNFKIIPIRNITDEVVYWGNNNSLQINEQNSLFYKIIPGDKTLKAKNLRVSLTSTVDFNIKNMDLVFYVVYKGTSTIVKLKETSNRESQFKRTYNLIQNSALKDSWECVTNTLNRYVFEGYVPIPDACNLDEHDYVLHDIKLNIASPIEGNPSLRLKVEAIDIFNTLKDTNVVEYNIHKGDLLYCKYSNEPYIGNEYEIEHELPQVENNNKEIVVVPTGKNIYDSTCYKFPQRPTQSARLDYRNEDVEIKNYKQALTKIIDTKADLDPFNRIYLEQLPQSIYTGMHYMGLWDNGLSEEKPNVSNTFYPPEYIYPINLNDPYDRGLFWIFTGVPLTYEDHRGLTQVMRPGDLLISNKLIETGDLVGFEVYQRSDQIETNLGLMTPSSTEHILRGVLKLEGSVRDTGTEELKVENPLGSEVIYFSSPNAALIPNTSNGGGFLYKETEAGSREFVPSNIRETDTEIIIENDLVIIDGVGNKVRIVPGSLATAALKDIEIRMPSTSGTLITREQLNTTLNVTNATEHFVPKMVIDEETGYRKFVDSNIQSIDTNKVSFVAQNGVKEVQFDLSNITRISKQQLPNHDGTLLNDSSLIDGGNWRGN